MNQRDDIGLDPIRGERSDISTETEAAQYD